MGQRRREQQAKKNAGKWTDPLPRLPAFFTRFPNSRLSLLSERLEQAMSKQALNLVVIMSADRESRPTGGARNKKIE